MESQCSEKISIPNPQNHAMDLTVPFRNLMGAKQATERPDHGRPSEEAFQFHHRPAQRVEESYVMEIMGLISSKEVEIRFSCSTILTLTSTQVFTIVRQQHLGKGNRTITMVQSAGMITHTRLQASHGDGGKAL